MLASWPVTLEQIAAQLAAEAEGLEAHTDPVVRAAAKRLNLWAEEVASLTDHYDRVTVSDKMSEPKTPPSEKSLADELFDSTGMRVRALWRIITEKDGVSISHETFNNVFYGHGKPRISPELREAVKRRTGLDLPDKKSA